MFLVPTVRTIVAAFSHTFCYLCNSSNSIDNLRRVNMEKQQLSSIKFCLWQKNDIIFCFVILFLPSPSKFAWIFGEFNFNLWSARAQKPGVFRVPSAFVGCTGLYFYFAFSTRTKKSCGPMFGLTETYARSINSNNDDVLTKQIKSIFDKWYYRNINCPSKIYWINLCSLSKHV